MNIFLPIEKKTRFVLNNCNFEFYGNLGPDLWCLNLAQVYENYESIIRIELFSQYNHNRAWMLKRS